MIFRDPVGFFTQWFAPQHRVNVSLPGLQQKSYRSKRRSHWPKSGVGGVEFAMGLIFLFSALCPPPSPAQSGSPSPKEDVDKTVASFTESVVVTARKREEDVQDVPLSISVLDSNQVQESQLETLDDLTLRVPNLNLFATRSSSSNAAIYIRGIGQEDTVFTVDSGVGLYLDDVYLPRAQGAVLDFLDIERVEVLRGPQGTLYGRNTSAGAIKYISKMPTAQQSMEMELTAGSYERNDFRGIFNMPFAGDKVRARLAVGSFNQEGFEFNSFTRQHTRSKDSLVGRLSVAVQPRENLDMLFRADVVRERPSVHVGALLRPSTTALDYAGLLAGDLVTIPVSDDPFVVRSNIQDRLDTDSQGFSSTINWAKSDSTSWKFVTSYRYLSSDDRLDIDASEASAADAFAVQHHKQASQEIQLSLDNGGRWNTVAGIYYFYEDDHQLDGLDGTAKGFSLDAMYAQTTQAAAAYSQTTYQMTDQWSLTAGLRFTYEEKEFTRRSEQHRGNSETGDPNLFGGFDNGTGAIPPDFFPGTGIRITDIEGATADWNALTPRLGLEYQWTDDMMFFASAARGFKSGGFNGRASVASNPLQGEPYDPEFVWTYEIGGRTAWLDNRLLFNATVFYNDYTDLQLSSFSSSDSDGDGVDDQFLPLFTNAGKAVTQGFELELTARPKSGLELFLGVGFTDSEFKEFRERGRDLSDERALPNAPEWTGTLGGVYSVPAVAAKGYTLKIGADVNFQGERFLTVSNLPDLLQDNYTVVNAFTTFESGSGRWFVTLGGRNLTDERYLTSGLDITGPPFGFAVGYFGDPRTWSLTLGSRF